jgi:oligopeptidase B
VKAGGDERIGAPPVAPRRPHVETWHGEVRDDPWFWLRDKQDPAVREYLEAENRYAEAQLAPYKSLAEDLYREMVARVVETDVSAPYPIRGYEYFTRTYAGRQYPAHFRRRILEGAPAPRPGDAEASDELLLDLNALAEGEKFFSIGAMTVSDDDRYLAYSTDTVGFRQYRLHVKDLRAGVVWERSFEKTVSIAWAGDGNASRAPTLLFTVEDPAKRPYRLFRIRPFDATAGEPVLVFEENDEAFNADVVRSRSGAFLFVIAASHTTSEFRTLRATTPDASPALIAARRHEHEYEVDHQGDRFLIRTNDRGRNFRLVEAPVATPDEANWRELVPHRTDVMLEAALAFEKHAVLCERANGFPRFVLLDGRGTRELPLPPNPVYAAFPEHNRSFATTTFRINYQSLAVPVSSYEIDVTTNALRLLKETPINGFDRAAYVTEQVTATAKDGTKVAISVVRRSSTPLDGSAPMHLLGYGAYGFPYPVNFLHHRLSLLDRGFVIALAHVRGGGERGKPWHDAGKMATKMNSFTDFIACAEELIARKYTSSARLVIEGGSAGGLLMGAVVNLRPDLFKAVIAKVPFVDAISSMLDETLPLTVGEFEEWGNPKIAEHYAWMRAYCPYSNLVARAYPAMLVRNSFNDSQVMYWEAAKYVAKMRTLKTNDSPLLLRTLMSAGHGGASGRYDALKDTSEDVAFILWQTASRP